MTSEARGSPSGATPAPVGQQGLRALPGLKKHHAALEKRQHRRAEAATHAGAGGQRRRRRWHQPPAVRAGEGAWEGACWRGPRSLDLDALLLQAPDQVRYGVLRVGHRQAVARHNEHALGCSWRGRQGSVGGRGVGGPRTTGGGAGARRGGRSTLPRRAPSRWARVGGVDPAALAAAGRPRPAGQAPGAPLAMASAAPGTSISV